jgi:hypothetical protein
MYPLNHPFFIGYSMKKKHLGDGAVATPCRRLAMFPAQGRLILGIAMHTKGDS